MGDRANVRLDYYWQQEGKKTEASIFIYTHWEGHRLPLLVHEGLALKARWEDAAYLTRIIADSIIPAPDLAYNRTTTTGYGISTWICDNEHAIIVLNTHKKTIGLELEKGELLFGHVPYLDFVETPRPLFLAYYDGDEDLAKDAVRELVQRANARTEGESKSETTKT